MKIENKVLIIDDEISDEEAEEFYAAANQEEIEKIIIKNPNIGASIVQILLNLKKDKDIETDDYTLKRIFENVIYKGEE